MKVHLDRDRVRLGDQDETVISGELVEATSREKGNPLTNLYGGFAAGPGGSSLTVQTWPFRT